MSSKEISLLVQTTTVIMLIVCTVCYFIFNEYRSEITIVSLAIALQHIYQKYTYGDIDDKKLSKYGYAIVFMIPFGIFDAVDNIFSLYTSIENSIFVVIPTTMIVTILSPFLVFLFLYIIYQVFLSIILIYHFIKNYLIPSILIVSIVAFLLILLFDFVRNLPNIFSGLLGFLGFVTLLMFITSIIDKK